MTRQGVDDDVETMSFKQVMSLAEEHEVMVIGGGEFTNCFLNRKRNSPDGYPHRGS